jgi:hypothetical protein
MQYWQTCVSWLQGMKDEREVVVVSFRLTLMVASTYF